VKRKTFTGVNTLCAGQLYCTSRSTASRKRWWRSEDWY